MHVEFRYYNIDLNSSVLILCLTYISKLEDSL